MDTQQAGALIRRVGRYSIFQAIAVGGMATVHFARFAGPGGFSRVVAIKHLHPHLSNDREFTSMFIGEARLASRIRHRNVVPMLDVVVAGSDLYLVMEYVQGESLSSLRKLAKQQNQDIPLPICSAIMVGALQGIHAAHEARNELGELLNIVHRDISPPNILIGVDGVPLVLDFGVAKAMAARREDTAPGILKGKSSYMSPEQIRGEPMSRAADIFAAAVVFWETLTARRLFAGNTEHERMYKVLQGADATPPSRYAPRVDAALDALVMKGLRRNPAERYATALEMAEAIERLIPPASQRAVGDWVARTATASLAYKSETLRQIEASELSAAAAIPVELPSYTGQSQGTIAAIEAPTAAARNRARSWKERRLALGGGAAIAALMAIMLATVGRPGVHLTVAPPAVVAPPRPVAASAPRPPAPEPAPTPAAVPTAMVATTPAAAAIAVAAAAPAPEPVGARKAGTARAIAHTAKAARERPVVARRHAAAAGVRRRMQSLE